MCAMRVSKSITDELGEREYASGLTKGPAAGVSERRQKTLDSHAMRNPLAFSLTSYRFRHSCVLGDYSIRKRVVIGRVCVLRGLDRQRRAARGLWMIIFSLLRVFPCGCAQALFLAGQGGGGGIVYPPAQGRPADVRNGVYSKHTV